MILIKAIVLPERVVMIKDTLQEQGFHGITTKNSHGYGEQKLTVKKVYRGHVFEERVDAVSRVELELVVGEDKVDEVIDIIRDSGSSGEGGDGRIYVFPLARSIHIGSGTKHLGCQEEEDEEEEDI